MRAVSEVAMAQRPTELVLTARVARMYYLDDRSKTEIADELAISRFRVARLLDSARRSGLVRIEIETSGEVDTDLSAQLQAAFGLAHAVVLDIPEDDHVVLRQHLGEAAAQVLREIVTREDVLGLAWARSLSGIGTALDTFVPCAVVQLTGALSRPDGSDVLELVRRVARAGGGPAHVYYAPLVAADATTARTLRRQPDVARAAALLPSVTVGVVGIGAWAPGLSTIFDAVEPDTQQRTARLGVVAEISGVLIDAQGRPLNVPLGKRVIGITGDELAGMRAVLAVAYGDEKAEAVRAALHGGLVSGLITHASLARRLLYATPSDGPNGQ
ncbi:MAG TPA: sugar-binding domain-containing protein [Jatrophihabitantaceae bacterium]|nr:sugar-binding domain-containing protein [Jatrophihabitantaceae bacterium]